MSFNTTSKLWILLALLFLVPTHFSANAFAEDDDSWGMDADDFHRDLGLSDEQREKMRKLRESAKAEKESMRKAHKEQRDAFKDLMKSDKSSSELRKAFQALQESKNKMATARFEHRLQVRDILTPEQRKKMAERRGDGRAKGKKRGQMNPRKRDGKGPRRDQGADDSES